MGCGTGFGILLVRAAACAQMLAAQGVAPQLAVQGVDAQGSVSFCTRYALPQQLAQGVKGQSAVCYWCGFGLGHSSWLHGLGRMVW
jgi:hypothetical protein